MALTAADRAQRVVDQLDERIEKVKARQKTAVEKVEARYKEELDQLAQDREHAANAPALKAQQQAGDAPAAEEVTPAEPRRRAVRDEPQA